MKRELSYHERATFCENNVAQQLFLCMQEKKSNLSLSADVAHCEEVLNLAERLGPHICLLKTHVDILEDFSKEFITELQKIARHNAFLIFEDRKFADIGNTVKLQYEKGVYHIADWAHIVNAHSVPGPGIIEGLASVGLKKGRALLMLAEMSSRENLMDQNYVRKTLTMAEEHPQFVIGFISMKKISTNPKYLYLTPGVQFSEQHDTLGQQYRTPEDVIAKNLCDVMIVGRGIIQAKDPVSEAEKYRKAGWRAYEKSFT